jgi:hypothetical protein
MFLNYIPAYVIKNAEAKRGIETATSRAVLQLRSIVAVTLNSTLDLYKNTSLAGVDSERKAPR